MSLILLLFWEDSTLRQRVSVFQAIRPPFPEGSWKQLTFNNIYFRLILYKNKYSLYSSKLTGSSSRHFRSDRFMHRLKAPFGCELVTLACFTNPSLSKKTPNSTQPFSRSRSTFRGESIFFISMGFKVFSLTNWESSLIYSHRDFCILISQNIIYRADLTILTKCRPIPSGTCRGVSI